MKKKEDYPEELTMSQADEYPLFKTFCDSNSYKKDYERAVKFAKKKKGQIYTMIDGEDNKTHYWKGLHYVNRFGFCVLGVKE